MTHSALCTFLPPADLPACLTSAWPVNSGPAEFWAGYAAAVADTDVPGASIIIEPPTCPSWCENAGLDFDGCGGEHTGRTVDVPATAGGWAADSAGALFPMASTYASTAVDGARQVALVVYDPRGERAGWLGCQLTPAEARKVAAALLAAAEAVEA